MLALRTLGTACTVLVAAVAPMASCRDSGDLLAPPLQAGSAGDGAEDPSVNGVEPNSSRRGVTLDITVGGSGFDPGSVVSLELQGVPATSITTNTTTYVTSTKLIANITIAVDADTGKYDVTVTNLRGRKGVGVELFDVVYELVDVGVIGGTWSVARAINERGHVVGTSCTQNCRSHAFFWSESGGIEDLGTLPGYTRSGAYGINDRGQVLGKVVCPMSDPGCGAGSAEVVLWKKTGGQWTVTRLGISASLSDEGDINNSGQFVTMGGLYALSGGARGGRRAFLRSGNAAEGPPRAAVRVPLPPLDLPPAVIFAKAINDLGVVAGYSVSNSEGGTAEAVIWFRDQSWTWQILPLGHLPGDNISLPQDIGELDGLGRIRVVGNSAVAGSMGGYHPVRWTIERVLVSFRSLSQIVKIDIRTGEILWRMGGARNEFAFQSLEAAGTNQPPFAAQHGLRVTGPGSFVLLDNLGDPGASRAERYVYDAQLRSATLVGAYGLGSGVVAQLGGTTQDLPNGHLLVTYGNGGRVEEYDEDGRVVWRIDGTPGYVFRAQRIGSLYRPGAGSRR